MQTRKIIKNNKQINEDKSLKVHEGSSIEFMEEKINGRNNCFTVMFE